MKTFKTENGSFVYREKIQRMCQNNESSFTIDYDTLLKTEKVLGFFLPKAPLEMLKIFDEVAKELVLSLHPSYERVTSEIFVRVANFNFREEIRNLRFVGF